MHSMVPFRIGTWYEKEHLYLYFPPFIFLIEPIRFYFYRWTSATMGKKIPWRTEKTSHRCNLCFYDSYPNIHGKQAMDFIYLGQKEEDKWEDPLWYLKRMKKDQFLQVLQTKDNFLFVIGQPDQQMRLVAKTKPSQHIGIKKEVLGLLLLLICSLAMKISF